MIRRLRGASRPIIALLLLVAAAAAWLPAIPSGSAFALTAAPAPTAAPLARGHAPSTSSARSSRSSRQHAATPAPPATMADALRYRLGRAPLRAARVGALVVSLRDGRTIFQSKPDTPLMPASTMKVMTGAAILAKLGPDWRFRTQFLADAPPVNGVIEGNLYVKGAGAPDLVVERFAELAAGIRDAGIREVRGELVADLSYFDGEERPSEWPKGNNPNPYAAPISALAANFSSVRVTVTPARRAGKSGIVVVEPVSDAVAVVSSVRTLAKGRTSVHAVRSLQRTPEGGVRNRVVVTGRIAVSSGPWEEFLPIEDPSSVAISAIRRALVDSGIPVRGGSRTGSAPPGAVLLYTLETKPLSEIVRDMNKNSNNFMAEMLNRTLGAESFGPPGSREKGARAVSDFLRSCGVDPSTLTLTDGSGLSRSNMLTASALVRVMVRMHQDPALGAAFFDSLPIGGQDGTLRGRMTGAAQGRVHAKTGHINGVTSLAGYISDTREGPVAFAFLVNGADHGRAIRALDELCNILCAP